MPTIRDVAEQAGCSIATVSRVLNGTAPIATDTRGRVAEAISALGYRRSEVGRSLKRQTTETIGLVVPSLTNPVFASSAQGVQSQARSLGMGVLLATSDYDPDLELKAVEAFLGQRVDGLLITVCDPENSPALALLDVEAKPYVLLYNQPTRGERPAVTVDNVAAAKAMTGAMLAAGHRRIAFVAGRFASSDRSRLRYQGFTQALAERGLAATPPIEVDFLAEEPDAALAPRFRRARPPTALFCSNDIVALAAIAALRRLGLDVPEDVSVTGFDGIAIGTMVHPALTTVRQPTRAMGVCAMELLVKRIAGRAIPPVTFVDYELRQGGTLAHARTQRRGDKSRRHGEGTPP